MCCNNPYGLCNLGINNGNTKYLWHMAVLTLYALFRISPLFVSPRSKSNGSSLVKFTPFIVWQKSHVTPSFVIGSLMSKSPVTLTVGAWHLRQNSLSSLYSTSLKTPTKTGSVSEVAWRE